MKIHTNLNLTLPSYESVIEQVCIEFAKAREVHGYFNSSHELIGVLEEEFDEFWDSVKTNNPDPQELIQIAATAIAGSVWLLFPYDKVIKQVSVEFEKFTQTHGYFNSAHELRGALKKAFDNFWDSVKGDDPNAFELIYISAIAVAGVVWLSQKAKQEIEELK